MLGELTTTTGVGSALAMSCPTVAVGPAERPGGDPATGPAGPQAASAAQMSRDPSNFSIALDETPIAAGWCDSGGRPGGRTGRSVLGCGD